MAIAYEGVQLSTIPLIPDAENPILWEWQDVPALDAAMIVSPGCPPEIVDTILHVTEPGDLGSAFDFAGSSIFGSVHTKDGIAYKRHHPENINKTMGIGELAVNVALTEGFDRIHADFATPTLFHDGLAVRFSGPRYFAALIPLRNPVGYDAVSNFVIAMSQLQGVEPSVDDVPAREDRMRYYHEATRACGMNPGNVFYDDTKPFVSTPKNMLIEADQPGRVLHIRKFDAMVMPDGDQLSL